MSGMGMFDPKKKKDIYSNHCGNSCGGDGGADSSLYDCLVGVRDENWKIAGAGLSALRDKKNIPSQG